MLLRTPTKVISDNADAVLPPALSNDWIEHQHVMRHANAFSEKCAAERIARDPRRQALPAGPMEVVATKAGVYDIPRQPGDRFILRNAQQDFSFNWHRPAISADADGVEPVADSQLTGNQSVI